LEFGNAPSSSCLSVTTPSTSDVPLTARARTGATSEAARRVRRRRAGAGLGAASRARPGHQRPEPASREGAGRGIEQATRGDRESESASHREGARGAWAEGWSWRQRRRVRRLGRAPGRRARAGGGGSASGGWEGARQEAGRLAGPAIACWAEIEVGRPPPLPPLWVRPCPAEVAGAGAVEEADWAKPGRG
jgi:hypothetical protein